MVRARFGRFALITAAVVLSATTDRVGAQQSRDAHLTVSVTVLAAAARVEHAEVSPLAAHATGVNEREVQAIVTAGSTGESVLTIAPRIDGVTVELVGTDGRTIPLGASGVRVARTVGGKELSLPILLRLRSENPALLDQAALAPVSLQVETAAR
jgi:hypothetical protein